MATNQDHIHITSYGSYVINWIIIIALTAISLAFPFFHLGFNVNFLAQTAVAFLKFGWILAFFMHLRYEGAALRVMGLVSILVLVIIFTLTFVDTMFRNTSI